MSTLKTGLLVAALGMAFIPATAATQAGATHPTLTRPAMPVVGDGVSSAYVSQDLRSATTTRMLLRRLEQRASHVTPRVKGLARTGDQIVHWFGCIHRVGIDRKGDPQSRWGFAYDERDGTGLDHRTALVRHPPGGHRPRWVMLDLSRRPSCLSRVPDPNGTGADAFAPTSRGNEATRRLDDSTLRQQSLTLLERARRLVRQVTRLKTALDVAENRFGKFDNWESCLVWLPVTEAGDRRQQFGYRFLGAHESSYQPAIDVDHSEWDDPDYEILVFRGAAQPFSGRHCGPGPGEGTDIAAGPIGVEALEHIARSGQTGTQLSASPSRLRDLLAEAREDLSEFPDDLEDMSKEGEEFVMFDECMFTIGVSNFGSPGHGTGYRFRSPGRGSELSSALIFDIDGFDQPQYDMLVFPGEEPPQIECNEDAGDQETDE